MTYIDTIRHSYALVFAGQGSRWRPALEENLSLASIGERVREAYGAARDIVAPVARDMMLTSADATHRLEEILGGDAEDSVLDTHPAVSGPGILLTQYAALLDLVDAGFDLTRHQPTALLGHSQGILGARIASAFARADHEEIHRTVALAMLIGCAATHHTHRQSARPNAAMTPMLSVSGVPATLITQTGATIAVNNGPDGVVISGRPRQLEDVRQAIEKAVAEHNQRIDAREVGGSIYEPVFTPLKVEAPFHSSLLDEAVDEVDAWVETLNSHGRGFDAATAHTIAASILRDSNDWPQEIATARAQGVTWFVDLGPTSVAGNLTAPLIEGTGCGVVDASTRAARTRLDLPGLELPTPVDWRSYAPTLTRLPSGRVVVETAFTRLTGKSPIILPGMTPTTVWPEIVAAAANGGHWAEMAGGGQYSEDVFNDNRQSLQRLLTPGHTAGFNTMFFDRFMWNLQFGVSKIVPKARKAGAPITSVTIAAGIPEIDEAGDLLRELRTDGFTHVCFKPGTVDQIRQVLAIAQANPEYSLILQVEDGHSGGHHSWEDLDDLLVATYAEIRRTPNVVLAVGGGIGTPEVAASYVTGRWALAYGDVLMPVDAVLVGTASMATLEARTSPQVKQLLVDTPGVGGDGWVGRGTSAGGMTSGLSHLSADMHEIDNSSARASRLIHSMKGDAQRIADHRDDIIDALNATAKPYFGDLDTMTYAQWATRLVDLTYPWADWTWKDRVLDVFHRIEGRLNPTDHGTIDTLFADMDAIDDAPRALKKLLAAYPQAADTLVAPSDAAWFPGLCRKHHKPMPFVPVLDSELAKWWGTDTLWQSHDERFDADQVRIIPGPRSVGGIDRIDEPIDHLFRRFEDEVVRCLDEQGEEATPVFARLAGARSAADYLHAVPSIEWAGNIVDNPAHVMPESVSIEENPDGWALRIHCATAWDRNDLAEGDSQRPHAVRDIVIPIVLDAAETGGVPVVDMTRLSSSAYDLLAGAAGVGTTTVNGDTISRMPQIIPDDGFGTVVSHFTLSPELGSAHAQVTGAVLNATLAPAVPDALVGPCWPAIYAALGSAIKDDVPVIEGLVNAVHLDHTVIVSPAFERRWPIGHTVQVEARCARLEESSAGRVVRVEITLGVDGQRFADLVERFAIRGRVTSTQPPSPAPTLELHTDTRPDSPTIEDTPRSFIRSVTVHAPRDMTAFAHVSGDFNPIHTSAAAARLSGLHAPLVHGMWLSAVVQHVIEAEDTSTLTGPSRPAVIRSITTPPMHIARWSYRMHGMVNLGDDVDIDISRVGHLGDTPVIEATCRVNGDVVSIGRAVLVKPRYAYVYPGQGIQHAGMGMNTPSATVREVWKRADAHTRRALGFSIETVVRDNPKELTIGEETFRHPDGVLNLTQFTQVALATVAYAQTQELRARGVFAEDAVYAGHSLGEYNALAACAQIFPFEKVLEIVFQRGTAMHHLVERDAQGRSNYGLGALRPDQLGLGEDDVESYVSGIAERSGEFLQIVNYNLAGRQYAIAGTIAGLEELAEDALRRSRERGGKRPFILIPGIDVPFHSSKLRGGVAQFREKLEELIDPDVDVTPLVGRYIPNLVARPFEVSEDFARAITSVVPSEAIASILADGWTNSRANGRVLLIELLAWQFASPVRWIETQDLLFTPESHGGLGVERLVEVGLASSPTLANLASRTLMLPRHSGLVVDILNVERDEPRVLFADRVDAPQVADDSPAGEAMNEDEHAPSTQALPPATSAPDPRAGGQGTSADASQAGGEALLPSVSSASGRSVEDIRLSASEAIIALIAYSTKVTREQISEDDTIESLTNGVSSKRNQLLMDMAAELGVPTIEGAADAAIAQLLPAVDTQCGSYEAYGPVLTEAVNSRVRKLLGSVGVTLTDIRHHVTETWALGQGWADAVGLEILLGSRDADSVRGGTLASLPVDVASRAAAFDLVDAAIRAVGARLGIDVAPANADGAASGGVVDSAALNALTQRVLGEDGVLASQARSLLDALGVEYRPATATPSNDHSALAAAVDAELGDNWVKSVEPVFSAEKAVLLDDKWALVREDLARVASGQLSPSDIEVTLVRSGYSGESLRDLAQWYATKHPQLRDFFDSVAREAMMEPIDEFAGDVALVTGAAPRSIAAAVVARLLEGGAQVIVTASSVSNSRLAFIKDLYRRHASTNASLWLVPANMASLRDIDALVTWIASEQSVTTGATTRVVKEAQRPTLFFPFAAPPVIGRMGEDPHSAMRQERLLLWSVEHTIHRLAELDTSSDIAHRLHVVLPGSPNRGIFGGDGAYAEAKASFDTIVTKWGVESGWPSAVTLAHPRIGWVKGTSLMGGNDVLVPAAQRAGIHVYTTEEIADELVGLASRSSREEAQRHPLDVDLTGGLGAGTIDLARLAADARSQGMGTEDEADDHLPQRAQIRALPSLINPHLPKPLNWGTVSTPLEDQVVIVGAGEVSAWGSGRTRHEAEYFDDQDRDASTADVELTAAGVCELAWMMGLIHWSDTPSPSWYDSEDHEVAEEEIFSRFHDQVVARSGIRRLSDDGSLVDGGSIDVAAVYLPSDQEFVVDSHEEATAYLEADPTHTRVWQDPTTGQWTVRKAAGSIVHVPRKATLSRSVGGQIPDDFDPAHWGIPASMTDALDRIAVWNLVTAVDAFISSGFTPTELLQAVHPSQVSSTQGTGIGGMESLRKVFLDRFLGEDRPQDILQEALPNVVAAHTMQAYIGGYGQMIHPVGACATAAVSIEEGVDKILLGKSDFVVAGGIDDITVESLTGFGDMNATAESATLEERGISPRHFSRAGDRRRAGFLEAEGGGTILLTRGSIAADLGLPVLGVVAYARSFADGAHTSIPAPGLGALAAGRGGVSSQLSRALEGLGLGADDIAVVSKHDTSTLANDPNEAELHVRLSHALGRSEGNPLHVISQKTVTGHAKGGAAVFQCAGLLEVFRDQRIPGNRSLDCLDPVMRSWDRLLWLRRPLDTSTDPVRAGILTSLGFGHVSAVVVLAHPGAFEQALRQERSEQAWHSWRKDAERRLRAGRARLEKAMIGHASLFEPIDGRRLPAEGTHEIEVEMLLNDSARLGDNGSY
ncbi:DUF1729 domain-containing protein [Schaalia sp. ZJ405]|uniref:type I polyketide synthase n=1 Tax=Schaalia sp. ZJ405 TaxID=2709403 RepID=UPI0013EA0EC5|nr:type I polyketide synthase [Schaalia sp. ZJ405]QPK81935.1 DUF1729 domain-containing protein [Schaalia sp. ZJ405]